jgi:hypothetical protein
MRNLELRRVSQRRANHTPAGIARRIRNKGAQLVSSARSRFITKSRIVALYGGSCVRCGFSSDFRALQLDHMNGRAELHRGGMRLYRRILAGLEIVSDYQLLCANCNCIKQYEQGEWRGYKKPLDNPSVVCPIIPTRTAREDLAAV